MANLTEVLEQGADEDRMGDPGPVEAAAGPGRAAARRVTKGKSRGRH